MKNTDINKINFVKEMLSYLRSLKSKEKSIDSDSKTILPNEILNYISIYKVPEQVTEEQAWSKIEAIIDKPVKNVQVSINKPKRLLFYFSAAALVLLILGISVFVLMNQTTTVKTSNGQILTYLLPDSSVVKLNSATIISYHTFRWTKHRVITIEGEAFFEVKKGNKFEVKTNAGTVTVYGTSFNVLNRDNALKVSCFTGKVGVKLPNNKEVMLLPGFETSTANGNKLLPANAFDKKVTSSWQTGEFYFSNDPLNIVFDELARQYNIQIKYPTTEGRHFSGYFNNKNLKNALDMICIAMQLKYTIINENIVVISTIK